MNFKTLALGTAFVGLVALVTWEYYRNTPAGDVSNEYDKKAPLKEGSFFHLESTWTDQLGNSTPIQSFRGQNILVAMLYTQCTTMCPMIVSDLKKIEAELTAEERKKVRFVIFSIDSARDTPEQLAAFASKMDMDPDHWTLLNGKEEEVKKVTQFFGISYQPLENGEFAHSNVITLLDKDGLIIHRQIGLNVDPGPTVAMLKSLK
jgi:protein SCO1/2